MINPIKRFWCNKVLPAVYDDALSYYEVLAKVTDKLNELIENVNSLTETINGIIESVAEELALKADKDNTVITGSLSLGRKEGTEIGDESVALGQNVEASGRQSFAEGYGTKATQMMTHAEGEGCWAGAGWSHAEGYYTLASGRCQHVEGKFNVDDLEEEYAHIIGNGRTDNSRSNAFTVDWDGNGWFGGDVKIGGESYDDENADILTTKTYVDEALNTKADKNNPSFTGDGYFSGDVYANGSKKLATVESAEAYTDSAVSTKADKSNPTLLGDTTIGGGLFVGDNISVTGYVFAENNKRLATQTYVNNAVADATGATIATGTFTPTFTSGSGSYLNIKQIGSVVYISGKLVISTKWADVFANYNGTLGEITGVGGALNNRGFLNGYIINSSGGATPTPLGVTYEGDSTKHLEFLDYDTITLSNDKILIVEGFYFV